MFNSKTLGNDKISVFAIDDLPLNRISWRLILAVPGDYPTNYHIEIFIRRSSNDSSRASEP